MPSSEDIRIQAQIMSSLQIDKITCFEWIKNQMDVIASEFYHSAKYVEERFTTTEPFEIYKPEREIVMLDKILKGANVVTNLFTFHGNVLTLNEPGTYTLRYYSYPDKPDTPADNIEMPVPYVNALKFYVAARIRARLTGQSDNDAVSFYEEYTKAIASADKSITRANSRYKRMPPARRGV